VTLDCCLDTTAPVDDPNENPGDDPNEGDTTDSKDDDPNEQPGDEPKDDDGEDSKDDNAEDSKEDGAEDSKEGDPDEDPSDGSSSSSQCEMIPACAALGLTGGRTCLYYFPRHSSCKAVL
jgi:hypothetical protein